MTNIIWLILGIISIALLIFYFRSRNAVWGGFTGGLIIGLMIAIFVVFKGTGFDWHIIGKGIVIGTILGFGAEMLGKVSDYLKKNKK